jgi:hypothetical protein
MAFARYSSWGEHKPRNITIWLHVQQAFLRGSEGLQLNHLVPEGHACSWPGREVVAGKDIKERKVRISAGTWFHDTKFT